MSGSGERSRKIPVTERQYLWVQDDDKGEVILHVGPTMVSPTAADRVVKGDGKGGFVDSNKPQPMIEVQDHQYAVLFNPVIKLERAPNLPNGKFKPSRNEARPLDNGTKQMIPGPCSFYLRPGQHCEVRDAHKLNSDQYLVVEVYSSEVDEGAPFYETTLRSAEITTFTDDSQPQKFEPSQPLENSLTDTDTDDGPGFDGPTGYPISQPSSLQLKRGQLIVIRGLDTQLYVPPTGVDVVPDTSADGTGAQISAEKAREILSQALMDEPEGDLYDTSEMNENQLKQAIFGAIGVPGPEGAQGEVFSNVDASIDSVPAIEQAARRRHAVQKDAKNYASLMGSIKGNQHLRDELRRQAQQTRLVRQAVVLREKEFCVVVDADGRRNCRTGPARVFPGPYDRFQVEGSRNRVYDAFELLPQRALWLRVVNDVPKQELASKLPRDFKLEKENYYPGDEVFLKGVSGFFFPFNEIEVLTPETGMAYIGNDHSQVFVEAIGIDQKSGIYVRDLRTGEARLVRGKDSYLVDPAKEIHISRTIQSEDWNQWVTHGERHKQTNSPITTPWALSITVNHGMAGLATSAKGQRVILGPCVELLEFEEKLQHLRLSTQTPKSDKNKKKTCFLRIVGNRVSDVVTVETSDFVKISIDVRFSVTFEDKHKEKWFNLKNYVQVLVDQVRSRVRNKCRGMKLGQLWPELPNVIRDTVLGTKVADLETGKETPRPGLFFEENGMRVTEVEVLGSRILDSEIAAQFDQVQRDIVQLQIGDHHAAAKLDSAKLRADIAQVERELNKVGEEQRSKIDALLRELKHSASLDQIEKSAVRQEIEMAKASEREYKVLEAKLLQLREQQSADNARNTSKAEADAESTRRRNEAQLEYEKEKAELNKALLAAQAKADVDRSQSIQPGLVEALTALGDAHFLGKSAENMNAISLVKGKEAAEILSSVFGGTKVAKTLKKMRGALAPEPQKTE